MPSLENVRAFRRAEIIDNEVSRLWGAMDEVANKLRVACPGIIQSWDPVEMTAFVQPCIREVVLTDVDKYKWEQLPVLPHVPVVYPRCGDFIITFPLNPGDECLVVFGDRSIDSWWQSGGIQQPMKGFVHDLSDGFCIPGPSSQPKKIANISTDSIVIRNTEGDAYMEIKKNKDINIVTAGNISMAATGDVTITGRRIDLNP